MTEEFPRVEQRHDVHDDDDVAYKSTTYKKLISFILLVSF